MEQRQWVDHRKLQGPQEARWKIRPVLASSNFNLEYINPYTDGKSHTPRLCGKDKRGKNKNQQACTQEREERQVSSYYLLCTVCIAMSP